MIVAAWSSDQHPEMNGALADWCAAHVDHPGLARGFPKPFTTMGVFDDATLLGVCVFHDWHPEQGTIEMSGASLSPRWLPRKIINEIGAYCFDQLKCQLLVMKVSEHNERLHKILRTVGFAETLVPRMLGRHEDQFIFTLADDEWRDSRFCRGMREDNDQQCA